MRAVPTEGTAAETQQAEADFRASFEIEFVEKLQEAKSLISEAWFWMDGTEGCVPGGEQMSDIAITAIVGWIEAERVHYGFDPLEEDPEE